VYAEDYCCQCFVDVFSRLVYDFCMMPLMVKEADLNRTDVSQEYEVLDATEVHDVEQSTLLY
jgi:hypothetical protein